jgi:hypothetical protein
MPPESQGVCHQSHTRIHDSSSLPSGRRATTGMAGTRSAAAGFRANQAPGPRPTINGAAAERQVSRLLGPGGDDILGALQETEEGRRLYDRLVATAQVGGVARHLLEEARRRYVELTSGRRLAHGGL